MEIFALPAKLDNSETSMRWIQIIAAYLFQTMDIERKTKWKVARKGKSWAATLF